MRRTGLGMTIGAMVERIPRITLVLTGDTDPISGTVSTETEPPRSFCGWLELMAALDAARSQAISHPGARRQPPRAAGTTIGEH